MEVISTGTLAPEKERLVKILKALGNPIRFQIIEFLAKNPTCITNDIVQNTPLAQSTVSQHLKVLSEAGLISGTIEGPATCYCLNTQNFQWLKEQIEGWLNDYEPACCVPVLKSK
jgi:ArsR family transcriptional regulator